LAIVTVKTPDVCSTPSFAMVPFEIKKEHGETDAVAAAATVSGEPRAIHATGDLSGSGKAVQGRTCESADLPAWCTTFGIHTRRPAWYSRAGVTASRQLVFTRSPAPFGAGDTARAGTPERLDLPI
jgi:hypothetical protein